MSDIRPDATISELLRAHPEVRPALQARGIDACCGGALTLAQAAEIRGVPLGEILSAVRAAAVAPAVRRSDSVREVIARHPQTLAVFERHGLMGCGGAAGPDERIDLFATIHHIDIDSLLAHLNEAVARGAEARGSAPSPAPPTLYRPFLVAALVSTLTMGATFGAINLLVIHWALGPLPPAHNWVHAGFQIWGFVLLFIMGVACHAVPRFLGTELRHPRVARAALWLGLSAMLCAGAGWVGWIPAVVAGAALQLAAVLGWAWALLTTWLRAKPRADLFQGFLAAGTLWWVAAAVLLCAGAASAVLEEDAEAAAAWNHAVYAAALFGGTLCWIQGMFLRTGPVFLELKPTRSSLVLASFLLAQAGALLMTAGFARLGHAGATAMVNTGLLATAASVVAFTAGVRPFGGRAGHLGDRDFARIVRMAFGGGLLFAALGAGYAIAGSAPRLMYDGARHAFTLGFVTLMIFGMAGRIVPVFTGNDLRWPRLRMAGAFLIAAGVVLREAQVAAALVGATWLMSVSGASGIVAAAGVALAGASILGTLRSRRPVDARRGRVPVSADANVAALVAAHEEALPILIEAGFTPLANPILRNTMARMVTLGQACRMHKIDVEPLVERIRAACPHERKPEPSALPAWSPSMLLDRETVLDALREVVDPELGADIVDLGLIYDVRIAGGEIVVRMTLTAPGCPHARSLVDRVRETLAGLPGVTKAEVELVFDPPWSPERVAPGVRAQLGFVP